MKRDFIVRGYAGAHHPRGAPYGELLLETGHTGEASAYMEIETWQTRMRERPGEVSRAELIDCRVGGKLTERYVYAHTKIPWSHTQ